MFVFFFQSILRTTTPELTAVFLKERIPSLSHSTSDQSKLGVKRDGQHNLLNRLPSWFSLVQSLNRVWLFTTPWTAAPQASLSITNSRSLPKLMFIESVMPSNYLILCHPLLLLPSIFPSIKVFSNESALCIRWLKYWSFSFNSSPSNEHPSWFLCPQKAEVHWPLKSIGSKAVILDQQNLYHQEVVVQSVSGVRLFVTPWTAARPNSLSITNSWSLPKLMFIEIQAFHPLLSPSSPALNLSQHQGLFQWVSSSHQVGHSIGASDSALVLPVNIQGWFSLGLTDLISLLSKALKSLLQHHSSKA